jgi:hypothetical protein
METGLRKRPNANNAKDSQSADDKNGEMILQFNGTIIPSEHHDTVSTSYEKVEAKNRLPSILFLLLHLFSVGVFGFGFILRNKLHNGEECEMTYSQRQFLHIELPLTNDTLPLARTYRLYKFVDQRDPRYRRFLNAPQPLPGSDWCGTTTTPTHVVLYIPGHWGSYSQSRSVGAHGIQLTGRMEDRHARLAYTSLGNNLWNGTAKQEKNFVYDVYSLDFSEQGGALHGDFLLAQSHFAAMAVEKLAVRTVVCATVFCIASGCLCIYLI